MSFQTGACSNFIATIYLRCRVNDMPIPQYIFIVRPVSAIWPTLLTDNLRGGWSTIVSDYEMYEMVQ